MRPASGLTPTASSALPAYGMDHATKCRGSSNPWVGCPGLPSSTPDSCPGRGTDGAGSSGTSVSRCWATTWAIWVWRTPTSRAYARRELVAFARDFGADGVQLEFLPVLAAGEHVWPLGYDEPALAEHRRRFGVDPRSIPADDPAWARLRAEYVTQFFRELRRGLDALGRPVEVAAATEGIWARPEEAYKLGLDWPTWVDEGLVDALYPRFFLDDPLYPPSDPSSESGCWVADAARIEREVAIVRGVVGNRCRICATAIASNAPEADPVPAVVERVVAAARAIVESGSDGFGIYTDARVAGDDALWTGLRRIREGRF